MELNTCIKLSLGSFVSRGIVGFTPIELADDVGNRMKKPKEEILRDVIDYCEELVWLGIIWSTQCVLHTNQDTHLVISRARLLSSEAARIREEHPESASC